MKPGHELPLEVNAAIITVSSTRTSENDVSGQAIKTLLDNSGFPVVFYSITPDEQESIRRQVLLAMEVANCIIVHGGTGLTHDDCTIEAVSPLMDKKIDGFGEMFRFRSMEEIGTSAMLSRAMGGVSNGKAIFCIPGSTSAVKMATRDLLIPEIRHILTHANK